jgi:hypothetical protein
VWSDAGKGLFAISPPRVTLNRIASVCIPKNLYDIIPLSHISVSSCESYSSYFVLSLSLSLNVARCPPEFCARLMKKKIDGKTHKNNIHHLCCCVLISSLVNQKRIVALNMLCSTRIKTTNWFHLRRQRSWGAKKTTHFFVSTISLLAVVVWLPMNQYTQWVVQRLRV